LGKLRRGAGAGRRRHGHKAEAAPAGCGSSPHAMAGRGRGEICGRAAGGREEAARGILLESSAELRAV